MSKLYPFINVCCRINENVSNELETGETSKSIDETVKNMKNTIRELRLNVFEIRRRL